MRNHKLTIFVGLIIWLGLSANYASALPHDPCQRILLNYSFPGRVRKLYSINKLRVGTYNLQNLIENPPPQPPNRAADRPWTVNPPKDPRKIRGIADAILAMNLDLMVVQEVDFEGLKLLTVGYLHNLYRTVLIKGNDPSGSEIGFLVKKDLPFDLTVESHRDETWVDSRDSRSRSKTLFSRDLPALLVHAQRQPKSSPPLMIILGTHYKSKRQNDINNPNAQDPTSDIQRREQVERTVSIVKNYQTRFGVDVPIMLAGDFNESTRAAADFGTLKTSIGFADAFDVAQRPLSKNERITHVTYSPTGGINPAQLDAVFLSPSLQDTVLDAGVYRYRNSYRNTRGLSYYLPMSVRERNKNPSDHWPVGVTLHFRKLLSRTKP